MGQLNNPFDSGDVVQNITQFLVEKLGDNAVNLAPVVMRLMGNGVYLQYLPFDMAYIHGNYNEVNGSVPDILFGRLPDDGPLVWITFGLRPGPGHVYEIKYHTAGNVLYEPELKNVTANAAFANATTPRKALALATCYFLMRA